MFSTQQTITPVSVLFQGISGSMTSRLWPNYFCMCIEGVINIFLYSVSGLLNYLVLSNSNLWPGTHVEQLLKGMINCEL
jgi:hypothetical protein